jgi:nicotinate-nucleotide adenylyltransferase
MIRALLGGSFDPFHNGHLAMVEAVLDRGLADRVLVVPAHRSPHKESPLASGEARLRMAELALADLVEAEVLDLEVVRGGISYTVDTVTELRNRWPDDSLRLVLGTDNLASFHTWHRPQDLLALADPLVLTREGWDGTLPADLARSAFIVADFSVPVSATDVRSAFASECWPTDLVPAPVLGYIADHGLYRSVRPHDHTSDQGGHQTCR